MSEEQWPQYESHKIVRAAKIVSIAFRGDGTRMIMVRPENRFQAEPFETTLDNQPAKVGDWAMFYPDGHRSVSPAKAFDEGYTRIMGTDGE